MNKIHVQFSSFEGPLDMLLSLIDEKKMEISDVSISAVTEPFLAYMDELEEVDAHELADFLVVAAKLLLLKSKTLLPQFAPEEDEGMSLEDQLKLYRQFVLASKQIDALWLDDRKKSYPRIEPPVVATEVVPPQNFVQDTLHGAMLALVKRLAPPKPLPKSYIDKHISLKQTIQNLRTLFKKKKSYHFADVIADAQSKTEIIVSFLALLELVKQKQIVISQSEDSRDISIQSL